MDELTELTDLPWLFQEFERHTAPATTVAPEGSGLSMALTKRLVELQGGSIEAQSV